MFQYYYRCLIFFNSNSQSRGSIQLLYRTFALRGSRHPYRALKVDNFYKVHTTLKKKLVTYIGRRKDFLRNTFVHMYNAPTVLLDNILICAPLFRCPVRRGAKNKSEATTKKRRRINDCKKSLQLFSARALAAYVFYLFPTIPSVLTICPMIIME